LTEAFRPGIPPRGSPPRNTKSRQPLDAEGRCGVPEDRDAPDRISAGTAVLYLRT